MLKRSLLALAFALFPSGVQANEVLDELSNRSQIPVAELEEVLLDCQSTQTAMNLCAFHDSVEAELNLDRVIGVRADTMSKKQASAYREQLAQWRIETEQVCNEEADAEAEGGSMRPMVYSYCMAYEFDNRATAEVDAMY